MGGAEIVCPVHPLVSKGRGRVEQVELSRDEGLQREEHWKNCLWGGDSEAQCLSGKRSVCTIPYFGLFLNWIGIAQQT